MADADRLVAEAQRLARKIHAEYVMHGVSTLIKKSAEELILSALQQAQAPPEREPHADCHDLVCNGDRRYPRGARGVTCSCRGRDAAYAEQAQPRPEIETRVRELLTCRNGGPHYCPNCDTSIGPDRVLGALLESLAGAPRERGEWAPIETAPKDRTIIGALISDGRVWRVHEMKHNGLAFYTSSGGSLPRMTHWMPLPAPPAPPAEGRTE